MGGGGGGICVYVLLMLEGLGDADFNLYEGEAGEVSHLLGVQV